MNNNYINDNSGFTSTNNFTDGEPTPVIIDSPSYSNYYNHKSRKSPLPVIIILFLIAAIVVGVLWYSGFFVPVDRQAEYDKLYARVCDASVSYANTNYKAAKKVSGKVVYVTVAKLANANLIEADLTNYLTNEPISADTNIRLEVLPSGTFECGGFLFVGDDKVEPIITLKGDLIINSTIGVAVSDPGYTAEDNFDGNITDNVVRSGTVNISKAGTYKINYVVSDISGNLSKTVSRTYIIK